VVRRTRWGRTHQNYFRDYDPAVGRYVQSDPIGLLGGINTYSYALQQPVHLADPTGEFVPLVVPAIEGLANLVGMVAAGSVAVKYSTRESSAQPTSGGGSTCPPDDMCRRLRESLQNLFNILGNRPLDASPAGLIGPARAENLRLRQRMNDLTDLYNKLCGARTGILNTKLPVGPQRPSIPGTPTIHEFYSK
jgi:RHS repeat-associated protein